MAGRGQTIRRAALTLPDACALLLLLSTTKTALLTVKGCSPPPKKKPCRDPGFGFGPSLGLGALGGAPCCRRPRGRRQEYPEHLGFFFCLQTTSETLFRLI